MKKNMILSMVVPVLLFVGCGSDGDSNNKRENTTKNNQQIRNAGNYQENGQNRNGQNRNAQNHNQIITAYFGDKENNLIQVVDIDNMKLIDSIATGHEKTYAVEVINSMVSHDNATPKMYIDNRGSNAVDVLDSNTNTITKTIELKFYPRSMDVQKETGLVAVSSSNKPMTSIIDSQTNTVIATVGEDIVTYPTTSGHTYISSGTLACGHPHWIDSKHFVLIDRQNRKIVTYKIEKIAEEWVTRKLNEITTPSPVHNLIPPEVHGHHGSRHHGINTSTIFYATAEGATGVYPSVLELEFIQGEGLHIVENLEIKKEGLSPDVMGVHHLNFLKDQKTIYVGSDEGNLFIVDYSVTPMRVIKTVQAGLGAGHTDEMKHGGGIAIVINHKDSFITMMNSLTNEKIADIEVSNLSKDELGEVQTQSHPKYHFSQDGRYFYLFLTEEGALVKVDLEQKKVVERLEIGGKLAMGAFVH
jgi:YVTN family beta-propeller protein